MMSEWCASGGEGTIHREPHCVALSRIRGSGVANLSALREKISTVSGFGLTLDN
jgi:hypothetical protein